MPYRHYKLVWSHVPVTRVTKARAKRVHSVNEIRPRIPNRDTLTTERSVYEHVTRIHDSARRSPRIGEETDALVFARVAARDLDATRIAGAPGIEVARAKDEGLTV